METIVPSATLTQPSAPVPPHVPLVSPVSAASASPAGLAPQPVVKVLSPYGVEYVFMTIALFVSAGALIGALLGLINAHDDIMVYALPVSALVISLPVFGLLFLRLKKRELADPQLKLDPSKRRSTQVTQIVAFLVSLLTPVGFVYSVFATLSGHGDLSIGKAALNAASIMVVSLGILAYYWRNEHRSV